MQQSSISIATITQSTSHTKKQKQIHKNWEAPRYHINAYKCQQACEYRNTLTNQNIKKKEVTKQTFRKLKKKKKKKKSQHNKQQSQEIRNAQKKCFDHYSK